LRSKLCRNTYSRPVKQEDFRKCICEEDLLSINPRTINLHRRKWIDEME